MFIQLKKIKQIFELTRIEFLFYSFIALFVITAGLIGPIFRLVVDEEFYSFYNTFTSDSINYLIHTIDRFTLSSLIAVFIAWAVLGMAVYLILWSLLSILINFEQVIKIKLTYTHPYKVPLSRFTARVIHMLMAIILPFAVVVLFIYSYPFTIVNFSSFINEKDIFSALYSIVGYLSVFLSFYIFIVWTRIMRTNKYF